MKTRESIEAELDILRRDGEWSSDIPLPHGLWTAGDGSVPHTRLRRIVQVAHDLSTKPLAQCRVLDLGSLDGGFAVEFALQGAATVGIEVREANLRKARFAKETLQLANLEFFQQDVRAISAAALGNFDIVVCSGILYHLEAEAAYKLLSTMFDLTKRLVIIDTHVALETAERVTLAGREYWGRIYREHSDRSTPPEQEKELLSSWGNATSFFFTRPSLLNLLSRVGFSSTYECFAPAHLNFGRPGIEHADRCTFVAVKDSSVEMRTSPSSNGLEEAWPEGSLTYPRPTIMQRVLRSRRLRALFQRA